MDAESHMDVLKNDIHCETRVITESSSQPCKVSGRSGSMVVRLPVVISRSRISISINARLQFDRYLLDIRNCKRELRLERCKLLDMGNARSGKLFMEGCVQERIEYVDAGCQDGKDFSGVLRYTTVEIPFACSTRIDYCQTPVLKNGKSAGFVRVSAGSARQCGPDMPMESGNGDAVAEGGIYYDIENMEISASTTRGPCPLDSEIFKEAEELMVVSVTILLLQEQLVNIC